MRCLFLFGGILFLLQSCTAAAFDKAHPVNSKPENEFPAALRGSWEAVFLAEHFYVDRLEFDASSVTYNMSALAEGSPSSLTLTKDSVELRRMKKDLVFNISGDAIWLCYIIRQPSKQVLEIWGFDESAKEYVRRYETETAEQGIEFVKYYATEEEWAKLVKSPALKKVASYKRTPG